jgi:CO/xanthine dehydrogenase FAD-binding subunit
MVAVVIEVNDGKVTAARVAVGSCSVVARRLQHLERDLLGVPVRNGLGAFVKPDHLAALSPITDVRATAEYRRDASLTLVQRALDACVEGD